MATAISNAKLRHSVLTQSDNQFFLNLRSDMEHKEEALSYENIFYFILLVELFNNAVFVVCV